MKKALVLFLIIFGCCKGQAQCTLPIYPIGFTQITSNTTINGIGTNYWICSGLTVTIASSQGDNYVCESNVTVNIINSAGDNVYAKPGCIINNASSQDISVICNPATVTLNNTGSGTITITQSCSPVVYDYSLVSNSGACGLIGLSEIESNEIGISPNPFSSQTVLKPEKVFNNATITFMNCYGQMVKQLENINGESFVLKRDSFANGLYFIQIWENNNLIAQQKLIITDS